PCSMRGAIELFQCAPAVNQGIGKAISEADTDSAAGFPASPPVEAHAGPNVWRPLPVLAKGPAKPINQSYGQNQDHVLPIAQAHFVSQEPGVQAQVLQRRAVVVDEPAKVGIGLEVVILR